LNGLNDLNLSPFYDALTPSPVGDISFIYVWNRASDGTIWNYWNLFFGC